MQGRTEELSRRRDGAECLPPGEVQLQTVMQREEEVDGLVKIPGEVQLQTVIQREEEVDGLVKILTVRKESEEDGQVDEKNRQRARAEAAHSRCPSPKCLSKRCKSPLCRLVSSRS